MGIRAFTCPSEDRNRGESPIVLALVKSLGGPKTSTAETVARHPLSKRRLIDGGEETPANNLHWQKPLRFATLAAID